MVTRPERDEQQQSSSSTLDRLERLANAAATAAQAQQQQRRKNGLSDPKVPSEVRSLNHDAEARAQAEAAMQRMLAKSKGSQSNRQWPSVAAQRRCAFIIADPPALCVCAGTKWHVHTYEEIFIVRQGRALFNVGDERFECEAGQIVFGPAGIPHKSTNLGSGRLETTDIHVSDRWIQTDLPDPEA